MSVWLVCNRSQWAVVIFIVFKGGPHPSTSSQHGKAAKIRSGMINDGHIPSGVRSLSANLRYPYKRTISAPAGMGLTQKSSHSRGTLEKEMSTTSGPIGPSGISTGGQNTPSTCHRQQSAPILKGKMSKESSHVLSKQGTFIFWRCIESQLYLDLS